MIRKYVAWGLAALLALIPAAARSEGPLSMASMDPGSSTYNVVLALAKEALTYAKLDIRPRPFKGTTQAISFVDSGEVNLGLESALGLTQAYTGTGIFDGNAFKNIRLVGTIYPFRVGYIVREDSPIKTMADLKGKRLVTNFRASPNITALSKALLATAGLTAADMQGLEVPTNNDAQDQFANGAVDATLGGVDSPSIAQTIQSVGPVRFLPLVDTPDGVKAAQAFLPNARVISVDPAPGRAGIEVPTAVLEYDYFIYANVNTPDDVVVGLIDSMIKGKDDLADTIHAFSWFDPAKMAAQVGIPYHPAAEAHYKELGYWPTP